MLPDTHPQLSMFEGEEVAKNVLSVGGTIKDPVLAPLADFDLGARQVLMVVTAVTEVKFKDGDVGRERHQRVEVAEAYQVEHLTDVWDLLRQVRAEQQEAIEARMGIRVGAELRQMLDGETGEIMGEDD